MNKKYPSYLEKAVNLPGVKWLQVLATAKGGSYLVTWAHRISGILLVVYVLLHINTLSSLSDPEAFSRKVEMFNSPATLFLEWLLAVPVIFHCLNGGRLLVYELYRGSRPNAGATGRGQERPLRSASCSCRTADCQGSPALPGNAHRDGHFLPG